MDWTIFLLLVLLIMLMALLLMALRQFRLILSEKSKVELAQISLLSKLTALLSSKDAMTFQAIQVMDPETQGSSSLISDSEPDIDELLRRAEMGDPSLTEEDYERIDRANFGP